MAVFEFCHNLLLVGLLAVLLMSPTLSAQGVTEIEVACFQGGYGIDFFEQCAREYEQAHPDIKINLWGNPRVWEQILPRIAAGNPPDLCWPGWGMNTWSMIFDNQFLPLEKYLDQPAYGVDKTLRETLVPSLLAKSKYEGQHYLFPYNFDAFGIWYNKNLFKQHGWQVPTTFTELTALCEQIKEHHIAPMTFTGRYPGYALRGFYFPWVISLGGLEVLNRAQNLEPGAWTHPAFVQAAEHVLEFKREGYFQAGCIGMNHTESQMEFLVGRAAMIPCGTWLHSEMSNLLPDDFVMEFMLCPVFEDGKGEPTLVCAGLDGKGWFIGAKSKHPDLAADFFRYLASPQNARRFVEDKGTLMSVLQLGEVNAPPHLLKPLGYVQEAKGTWTLDYEEWYPEFGTEVQNLFRDLYNGLLSPEQFVQGIEKQAEKLRSDPHVQRFTVP